MKQARGWLVGSMGVLLAAFAGFLWLPRPGLDSGEPSAALLAALDTVAIPLSGADPDLAPADLAALDPFLAGRRIVAMGEATHGTREFFRMKDRVFRYLVARHGFAVFGMEASKAAGEAVNGFVQGGPMTADSAVRSLDLWPWETEEVRDMLFWMREHNRQADPAHRIRFMGFSVWGADRDRRMADNVTAYLSALPDTTRMFLWAHNAHVAVAGTRMGRYLRDRWGDACYVIGFEFDQGGFRSRTLSRPLGLSIGVHQVGPAGPAYYAHTLARLSHPVVFLDLSRAEALPPVRQWLGSHRLTRSIDEMFRLYRVSRRLTTWDERWPGIFDAVIFFRTTSPARGLGSQ